MPKRPSNLPISSWKQEIKSPMWKIPFLYQEKETFFNGESKLRESCINRTVNSYLPLTSPYNLVTFPQFPLFVQPNVKACRFCHFSASSFSYQSPVSCKTYKFVYISPVLCQFNSQAQLKTPKKVEVKFCLPYILKCLLQTLFIANSVLVLPDSQVLGGRGTVFVTFL